MPDDVATKKDLKDLEVRLLAAIDDRTRAAIAESEERMKEFSRDLQTEILRSIYQIAETSSKRLAALERADISFTERFIVLENRILSIEKRLDLPHEPAA